jgi:molecular chaperone DnaK
MTYSLGIDLGATSCVVAMRRGAGVEVCRIGRNGAGMPAIALPQPHGSLLVGEDADARSAYEPALVARYVVSRLGDGEPIDIDGRDLDPLALTRAVLREAVERAAPRGTRPDQIVVTYPLSPGVGPEELIADAAAEEFGPTATLVPAPVAAVARFAAERSLDEDAVVAVVDVGGSSVDVTLVRRTPTAFDLVGEPATLADLGGVDLDSAVLSLVEGAIGDVSSRVGPGDSAAMVALRRLRASCRAAKERLSVDHIAVVEVAMPDARGHVEITRDAFERTIEPALLEATDLVLATIAAAGLIPADLRAVVVTGGSARIPRVTELVEQQIGLPVLVEARPEQTVALGAALFSDVTDVAEPAAAAPDPQPGRAGGGSSNGRAAELGLGAGALGAGLAGAAAGAAEDDDAGGGLELAGTESIAPIGPTTGGGPLPWEDAHPDNVGTGGLTRTDPWARGSTAGLPAEDDPWADRGPRTQDGARGWDDWGHDSTTVFAAAGGPGAPASDYSEDVEWGQTSDDEVRRLTTSDTDPFGRSGTRMSRLTSRSELSELDDDDEGGFDIRILVGGLVAAVLVIAGGLFLMTSSRSGDDPAIAVADTSPITSSTTTSTSTTTTTTTVPPTTAAPTTETTEPPTTTTTTQPRPRTTTTTVPPTTEPPTTEPPTTEPPTTAPPTTPTTAPTTTTTPPGD